MANAENRCRKIQDAHGMGSQLMESGQNAVSTLSNPEVESFALRMLLNDSFFSEGQRSSRGDARVRASDRRALTAPMPASASNMERPR